MKYIIKIVASLCLIVTLSSCEGYLEEVNPNGVSTDTYWANLDEVESTLSGVYNGMLNTFLHNIGPNSLRGDVAFPFRRVNTVGRGVPFYQQTFTNNTVEVEKQWEALYQVIFRANQVIKALENLAEVEDQERWEVLMGQARFFRGLAHFYLHNDFNKGSIIIRDKVPVTNADFNKALSTSSEVIAFFRADLLYAYQTLPAKYEDITDLGRATRGAAATILGTSHLYEKEYTEAMTYFNDIIDNPDYGYELVEDMSLIFTNAGEFNAESILEISYSIDHQAEDTQWDEESFNTRNARFTAPNNKGGGSNNQYLPAAWLTYAYGNEALDTQDPRNQIDTMGGTRLRNVSLRASSMIALVQDIDTEFYLEPSVPEACTFPSLSFSFFKHFSNHDIVNHEKEIGATPWKSGKNHVVNRLAEVYLMLAECQIQTGDIPGALASMNAIRTRWGLQLLGPNDGSAHDFDEVNYTTETLMDHLMYVEKPLELSIEGHSMRAIDMRRWGITESRFNELSTMEFYVEDFTYTTGAGSSAVRKKALVMAGTSPDPDKNPMILEFQESPLNYFEELHAWFPIPLSEVQNNSSVN